MFDYSRLKGCFATLITPFNERSNTVNKAAYTKQVEFLCESEITGLFPLATFSEFPFMQYEEKKRVLELTALINRGRKLLLAGCCGVNEAETLQLLKLASEYGYDAAVVCPPYYFKYNGDELYEYYTRIAANPYGMKIIMYNIPAFTSELPVSTIGRLLENPQIIGVKDSSGNARRMSAVTDLKTRAGREFIIFCGSDDILLPAFVAGCEGSLSAMSCILPEAVSALYKAYRAKDMERATEIQRSFVGLVHRAESVAFPTGYMAIAEARGIDAGYSHQYPDMKALEELRRWIEPELDNVLSLCGCTKKRI